MGKMDHGIHVEFGLLGVMISAGKVGSRACAFAVLFYVLKRGNIIGSHRCNKKKIVF